MRWAGFLRNVMVGREGLQRDVLLGIVHEAGGAEARTHLTTGNVTFTAEPDEVTSIVRGAERGLGSVIGRRETVVVRELRWLRELVDADPFAAFDPSHWELEVALLAHDAPVLEPSLLGDSQRTVIVTVGEREVLSARPRHGGRRPHANRLVERAAGLPATSRAWSTLRRVSIEG